ncbi:MAG: hypothetical protein WA631_17035 [Nitrososphaeraceae archaeon]
MMYILYDSSSFSHIRYSSGYQYIYTLNLSAGAFPGIKQSKRIENTHDMIAIATKVEELVDVIRSMTDKVKENNNYNRSIKEEKMLMIAAAKQFWETLMSVKNKDCSQSKIID